ncbi:MAG: tRNA (adenosine(37)-N6)-threonylcarbamoyltransferase complex ATPase subunit type 1 TsaE [Ginsengibacter sp.]
MEIIFNLTTIRDVAKKLISLIQDYKVITFSGELGAGKTTFINAICKELGVTETVTSPTYAIIQEYHFGNEHIIYHMDLYRVKNIHEAVEAGVEDCLLSGELCMVEWPEKASLLFPGTTVNASLHTLSDHMRKLVVKLPQ